MNLRTLFSTTHKENLFELHPDAIIVLEPDGKILDVNSKGCKLFATKKMGMAGNFLSDYIQGGSVILNKIVNTENSLITKAICQNKEERIVEITASQDKETQKVYVALRDITQNYQKQSILNSEFEIAKNIIDEKNGYLNANAGEILSFVSSMESFSKALLDEVGGELSEKQKKYAQIINKNSEDLLYDLEKLFSLFKMESGLHKFDYKTFDIVNLLNGIVKKWDEKFAQKKVTFTYDFSQVAVRNCYMDLHLFEYLIASLLELSYRNTDVGTCSLNVGNPPVKFLQDNGLDVTNPEEENEKRYVMFELKDSSNALLSEELKNIFNPYHIIKKQQKRSVGSKCTYAVAQKIIKAMGGEMWVYSKAAQGNMISFILPIEKTPEK